MVKLKVNKDFKDKYSGELYKKGSTIEVDKKRADEISNNLGKEYVEVSEQPKRQPRVKKSPAKKAEDK